MADIGKNYTAETQILGSGDGYVTLSGTTMSYSDVMTGDAFAGFQVSVEVNFDSTPTDDVEVWFFPSRDGTPTNPDDVGKFLGLFDKSVDPNQQTFDIPAHSFGRIGVVQTGSTDSHDVRAYVSKYTWESV